ncbi:MAG: SBBP repeat-containing protein [Candidatus Helarchaeota archaeon]|nr:SBBP repeat-containing protein [Candidatus Helarchaeota archaeon]
MGKRFLMGKKQIVTILFVFAFIFNGILIHLLPFNQQSQKILNRFETNHRIRIQTNNVSYVEEWYRIWGGSDYEVGYGVALDGNNDIYLAGATSTFGAGNYDALLVKYDFQGTQLWNRTWGRSSFEDLGTDVAVDGNKSIYITGYTTIFGSPEITDAFLVKYDSQGNEIWNRTWGGTGADYGNGIAVDSDNNCYITGYTNISDGNYNDAFLVKYDPQGTQLWNRTWGLPNNYDRGSGVAIYGNNHCYLIGYSWRLLNNYDAFVVKYDGNGTELWNQTWGTTNDERGRDIAVAGDHTCYLICYVSNNYGLLVKFDANGTQLWNRTWGGLDLYGSLSIAVAGNDQIFFTGSIANFGPDADEVFLVKYDAAGNWLWNRTWGSVENEHGYGIIVDGNNNTYLVGDTEGFISGWSAAFLVKFGTDSDEDGLTYDMEVLIYGSNPNDPDTDGDLIPDGWEVDNNLDLLNTTDAQDDFDGDGLTNLEEYNLGTNLDLRDSDYDEMPDGWEVTNGLDPLNITDALDDPDEDDLINIGEYRAGTDPNNWDTDGDGFSDGTELSQGTNPLDRLSNPLIRMVIITLIIVLIALFLGIVLFIRKRKRKDRKIGRTSPTNLHLSYQRWLIKVSLVIYNSLIDKKIRRIQNFS